MITYSKMKTEKQESFRLKNNRIFLQLVLMSMFEYKGLPDTIPQRFLETYLIEDGTVGIGEIKDNLYAFRCSPCGNVDAYGIGTELTGATPIGDITGVIGESVVMGINNSLMESDRILHWFCYLLSEIDLSMQANIINARLHPTPVARDSKVKAVIDNVLTRMRKGEMESIVSDNILSEWNDNFDIPVVNLTNITNIDKIQYLSRFYDDTLKRYYNMYGHALQTQNKSAQQTLDEVHGMDSTSLIIPLDRLKCRKEMVSEINRVFGLNVTVEFSPTWKLNMERFERDNKKEESVKRGMNNA